MSANALSSEETRTDEVLKCAMVSLKYALDGLYMSLCNHLITA
jgi:hypothetical protein